MKEHEKPELSWFVMKPTKDDILYDVDQWFGVLHKREIINQIKIDFERGKKIPWRMEQFGLLAAEDMHHRGLSIGTAAQKRYGLRPCTKEDYEKYETLMGRCTESQN